MYSTCEEWLLETVGFSLRAENIPPEAIKYVQEAWRLGAAAEREACARIAESLGDEQDDEGQAFYVALKIAADIRARSNNSN